MTFWRLSLWIVILALCVGLGILLIPPSTDQKSETPPVAALQPVPKTDQVATGKVEMSLIPSFDIVRLEPNGDLVVAGRAGAKAIVTLIMDGKDWDKASTDETGQFAMTPKSLSQGPHQLSLVAKMPDGKEYKSAQVVALDVPALQRGKARHPVQQARWRHPRRPARHARRGDMPRSRADGVN